MACKFKYNGQTFESKEALADYFINSGVDPELGPLDGGLSQTAIDAQAKLKGTVGGVQGIIEINRAVATGEMTELSAEALLVEIYGFAPELAARLIEAPTASVTEIAANADIIKEKNKALGGV